MKKCAFLLAIWILCASLAVPVFATGSSGGSSSADASSSEPASSGSSSEGSSSSSASSEASSGAAAPGDVSAVDSLNRYKPSFEQELYSQAIYMLNLDSDTPIYQKSPDVRMPPASLTKIMTCIVALESGLDLEETTPLKAYIQNELYNLQVDTLGGIYLNEELKVRDLLYAMMLQSANEAAMMVADFVGDGSIERFCEMMNEKAREIGAKNTNFANASGLYSENSYTTAYDMALIAKYAMENDKFVEIVTTLVYTSDPTERHPNGILWTSINNMQKPGNEDYYEGLKGVKTGSLPDQNIRNFLWTATRDGYSYLLVCLGAPAKSPDGIAYQNFLPWFDTRKLYDWAFDTFEVKTLMEAGEEATEVAVRLNWDVDKINLLAASSFSYLVPKETGKDDVSPIPDYPQIIDAPIKKGQKIGSLKIVLAGEELGTVDLVAAETVPLSKSLYYLDQAKSFLDTFLFKFVLVFFVVILVLYIALMMIRNHNRRRYKARRRRRRM